MYVRLLIVSDPRRFGHRFCYGKHGLEICKLCAFERIAADVLDQVDRQNPKRMPIQLH